MVRRSLGTVDISCTLRLRIKMPEPSEYEIGDGSALRIDRCLNQRGKSADSVLHQVHPFGTGLPRSFYSFVSTPHLCVKMLHGRDGQVGAFWSLALLCCLDLRFAMGRAQLVH